jgi:alpha-tubulin suppressor-like RCC1 family protein
MDRTSAFNLVLKRSRRTQSDAPCPPTSRIRHQASRITCFALAALLAFTWPVRAGIEVVAWGAGMINDPSDGDNDYGQSIVPTTLTNAVLVAGGRWHSLALKANGTLLGWGDDSSNETNFPAGSNYVAIACNYLNSVALESNGTVIVAGDDSYGQTAVPGNLSNVVAVACGWFHCLALKSDGTVAAWGTDTNPANFGKDNVSYGQSDVPPGLSNVVAIAGGGRHSLALKADGTLTGWGNDQYSQTNIPPGVSNVVAIAASAAGNLVLEANGTLVAWGDNTYGQTNVPTSLTNGVVAIAAGGWHYLALKTNGTVVAWGAGAGSSVGYGQTNVPAGLTNVIQIAAGLYHSLALVGSGPPKIKVPLVVAGLGTNGFVTQLPTRNGRVYRLEYENALANQTWNAFPLQYGSGGTNRFTDTNRAAPQRFYRVSRW